LCFSPGSPLPLSTPLSQQVSKGVDVGVSQKPFSSHSFSGHRRLRGSPKEALVAAHVQVGLRFVLRVRVIFFPPQVRPPSQSYTKLKPLSSLSSAFVLPILPIGRAHPLIFFPFDCFGRVLQDPLSPCPKPEHFFFTPAIPANLFPPPSRWSGLSFLIT